MTTAAAPSKPTPFDLGLGLEETHVLVTGGCGLIGRVVVDAFLSAGARVTVCDLASSPPFDLSTFADRLLYCAGDITSDVDDVFERAETRFGPVECVVALASYDLTALTFTPSICDADVAEFRRVMNVNVTGTFLTVQRWLRGIRAAAQDPAKRAQLKNVGLIMVGSEAGIFGVPACAAYSTGKAAIQVGLLKSVAQDCPKIFPRARINALAPGPVETPRLHKMFEDYGSDWRYGATEATFGLPGPVTPEDCARQLIMLASERYSGSVHGQLVSVDGGKQGNLVWDKEAGARARDERVAARTRIFSDQK